MCSLGQHNTVVTPVWYSVQVQGAVKSALDQQAPLTAAQEGEVRKDMELFLDSLQNSAYSQGLTTGTQTAAAQVLGKWR